MKKKVAKYFARAEYKRLNAKQKEVYNLHHIGALLAKCGYANYVVRDDWNGADLLARHMITGKTLAIQVKSRATFAEKYRGKGLWIGYPDKEGAYVYPHDQVLSAYTAQRRNRRKPLSKNKAWTQRGSVSWPRATEELLEMLAPYRIDA